ncbi:IclR family transcriptional regulator domain-containing protein [Streptomyces nojiriensis]|uniref:IclR family transcriptional regulator domain-containing protein n=1 Tax=Streptomyces nojiriensis TaxID=66374 RepID=UPI0036517585
MAFTDAAHANAVGKSLLARLDFDRRMDHLSRHRPIALTQGTITDGAKLFHSLDGHGPHAAQFDILEYSDGRVCVAVPLVIDGEVGCVAPALPVAQRHGLIQAARIPSRWTGDSGRGQGLSNGSTLPRGGRAGQGGAEMGGQPRTDPEVAVGGVLVGKGGGGVSQTGWKRGTTSRTSSGVRRVKCCQMKIREDSIGSVRSVGWQPSTPTKMTARWVWGSSQR